MSTIANKLHRNRRRTYIENYEFPTALHNKLVDELGSGERARIALDGLRAWYLACLYANGELIGMPSRAVDVAWHEMILRTHEYHAFCSRAFGFYLHHSPDSTLDVPMSAILPSTLQVVEENDLPMTLFSADEKAGVADGYSWSEEDLRWMREAARPRRRRSWASSTGYWAGGGDYGGGGHHGGG